MYSRAAISKQANIVNSNSLTFARALSSGNNEINNAILVDYNHVPRQYWPARFCLATVKSRDNCCKTDSFSWESSINLDLDFLFLFLFLFFLHIFLVVKQSYERRSYNFCVDMRESEGENDWSTWYWCEIMIEYFVQFSTTMLFSIFCLNINLACIFASVVHLLRYRGICSVVVERKTCFFYYYFG